MPNDVITVKKLLKAAGISRSSSRDDKCGADDTDHIVELQLVVAALNYLKTAYRSEGWQRRLVEFFDKKQNKQCLTPSKNRVEKKTAVKKLIQYRREDEPTDGWKMSPDEWCWIEIIKGIWDEIKGDLRDFAKFKDSLDKILDIKDEHFIRAHNVV